MMIKKLVILAAIAVAYMFSSCTSSKKIIYMQDAQVGVEQPITVTDHIVARPKDKLQIIVNCADPQTAAMFALAEPQKRLGADETSASSTGSGNTYTRSYLVDEEGNVEIPVLGTMHVGGLSRQEIEDLVKNELIKKDYVKDPLVVVEFTNLSYTILGDVGSPGKYDIKNERTTILEAIAEAGDLAITGRRDNIRVIREENGQRMTYMVDLRDSKFLDSPAYMIQQNDLIYVEPNDVRTGQSAINENNWKAVSTWMSMTTFLMTIVLLVVK
jgi:polysaccharide export outer membrane protein